MEKFSIIVRNRNEEAWIGHCIQSIIENFEDPEIIIIDNNSSDNTINLINRHVDSKIKLIKMQSGDLKDTHADISKLMNKFKYKPKTSVYAGISKFVDWYKYYYKIK